MGKKLEFAELAQILSEKALKAWENSDEEVLPDVGGLYQVQFPGGASEMRLLNAEALNNLFEEEA